MSRRWIWVTVTTLFLLLTTACCSHAPELNNPGDIPMGQRGHAVVMIHRDFSKTDIKIIKEGIDLWVKAARGLYTVEYKELTWANIEDNQDVRLPSGRCQEVIVFELSTSFDKHIIDADNEDGKKTLGRGRHRSCGISRAWLVVDRLHTDHTLRMVASHEFGHAIDLDHVEKRGSVMFRSIASWTAPCITREDAVEFCKELLCNPENIKYCKKSSEDCDWIMPELK